MRTPIRPTVAAVSAATTALALLLVPAAAAPELTPRP